MNCIQGLSFIFSLIIILSAFNIEYSAGKKETLMDGMCYGWFEQTVEEPGSVKARWSTEVMDRTCQVCNTENVKKSWLITKMVNTQGYKLLHLDVDVWRRSCKDCKNQNVTVYILKESLPTGDDKKSQETLNKLLVLTTLTNSKDDIWQVHHFQFEPISSKFSIVFLSEGSCTRIRGIKVSSFVCEQNLTMGVSLPRTVAPASGFTKVNISCPESTLNPENESAYGLCSYNGRWNITSPCMCEKGFTLATVKEGCEECLVNTYKDDVGNGKCSTCPRNSKSGAGQHQCLCKEGFYRFLGDYIINPCHGIPSKVREIKFTDKTETSVALFWKPPETSGAPDQDVFYDIKCKKCQSGSDSKPCEDSCGKKVLFIPRQYNLTNTSVTVKNLEQDTEYEFVIYSKNLNSFRINSSNWIHVKKKIKTEGLSKSDGLPAAVVIGVPVIVVIMMIIITIVVICLLIGCKIRQFRRSLRLRGKQADVKAHMEYVTPDDIGTEKNDEDSILARSVDTEVDGEHIYQNPDELDIVLYEEVPNVVHTDENRQDAEVQTNNLQNEKLAVRVENAISDNNQTEPYEEVPNLTRSVHAEIDEKNPNDPRESTSINGLVYVIPLDDQTKSQERTIMVPEKRGTKKDDSIQSQLLEDKNGYLLPADGGSDLTRNAKISEPSAYAKQNENARDGRDMENTGHYQKLLKCVSDYVIPADGETDRSENVQILKIPADEETNPRPNVQILELDTYTKLKKNRQNGRDKENVNDYQKLLKPESDYVIPADGESASSRKVQTLEPSAYTEVKRTEKTQQI